MSHFLWVIQKVRLQKSPKDLKMYLLNSQKICSWNWKIVLLFDIITLDIQTFAVPGNEFFYSHIKRWSVHFCEMVRMFCPVNICPLFCKTCNPFVNMLALHYIFFLYILHSFSYIAPSGWRNLITEWTTQFDSNFRI